MLAFAVFTSYQKRLNKVLSFVVMDYGLCYVFKDFLCISQLSCMKCVCMCVKQQTDDLYAQSSVIYIVVIDSGW